MVEHVLLGKVEHVLRPRLIKVEMRRFSSSKSPPRSAAAAEPTTPEQAALTAALKLSADLDQKAKKWNAPRHLDLSGATADRYGDSLRSFNGRYTMQPRKVHGHPCWESAAAELAERDLDTGTRFMYVKSQPRHHHPSIHVPLDSFSLVHTAPPRV